MSVFRTSVMVACVVVGLVWASVSVTGCETSPDGNVIIPGEKCHQLLQTQCRCCGTGETSCTARVDYLVVHANAITGLTEADCQVRLDDVGADEPAWCEREFDTASELSHACQGFPPSPSADVTTEQ